MSSSSSPASSDAAAARVSRYEREALETCAALLTLEKESSQWKQMSDSDGIKIKQKEAIGDEHAVFMGSTVADAPLAVVMELVMDTAKKPQYDSVFDKAHMIEELTAHVKVEKHNYWAPPLVAKRDFCMLLHKCKLEDGTVVLTGRSTEHAACPPDTKYLRATVHMGGWILRAVDDEPARTHITFIASSDLGGSLPAAIKSRLAIKQPELVGAIKPLLAKRLREIERMSIDDREKTQRTLQALTDVLPTHTQAEMEAVRSNSSGSSSGSSSSSVAQAVAVN